MAASDYRIKAGFNVAYASLNIFAPQPTSEGVKATRIDFTAGGIPIYQGLYVQFVWPVLGNKTIVQSILTASGLGSATFVGVTINARDEYYDYHRYNGVAIRPQPSWQQYFPRNFVILVRDLELIA